MTHDLYIHGSTARQDGTQDSFFSTRVESKDAPMMHHKLGLSYTASGYGSRIPMPYVVKFNGKWRRVYARCYSNNATLYIGKLSQVGERLMVRDYDVS